LILRKDETGEMSRAIEKMRQIIKTLVLRINDVSQNISNSSQSLSQTAYSVNDHASDNSATTQELSAGMEETAATTEQIYANIEQIGNYSRDINEKATNGAQISAGLISSAQELKAAAVGAAEKTRRVYEEVKAETDAAIEKSKAVDKIGILVKTIKDIAGQTKLLAFNASIEAARAGDAGKGFSIVAGEIGSLAEQSSRTVANINGIVNEVYQAVDNMSHSLLQTLNFLENNVQNDYIEFLNSSEKYNSEADIMHETMESIHKQIEVLNSNVISISDSIGDINTMVSEASKGVSDVAEKTADIVALTTNTQEMSKENAEYAAGLQEIVEKFRI
jgi:methyl-accepting chemotaxis protein